MKQYVSTRTVLFLALAATLAVSIGVVIAQDRPAKVCSLVRVANPPSYLADQPAAMDKEEFDQYRQLLAVSFKTPWVLHKALKSPAVTKLDLAIRERFTLEWLEQNLNVDFVENAPSILRISLKGNPPDVLAILVDAVTEVGLSEAILNEKRQRQDRLDTLRKLFAANDAELSEKRRRLNQLKQRTGVEIFFEVQAQELSELKKEMFRLRLAQAVAKEREKLADKEATPTLKQEQAVLAAQAAAIEELFKSIEVRNKATLDLTWLEDDIAASKDLNHRLKARATALMIELEAPPRVALLQSASDCLLSLREKRVQVVARTK